MSNLCNEIFLGSPNRGQSGRESEDGGGAKDRGEAECGKEHKLKVQAEQMMNKAEELQI